MVKQIIWVVEEYAFPDLDGCTLVEASKKFEELVQHYPEGKIDYRQIGWDDRYRHVLLVPREETDDEEASRIALEEKRKHVQEEREKAQLKELLEKYKDVT